MLSAALVVAAHEHGVPFVTATGVAVLGLVMALRRPLTARREADAEALKEAEERPSSLPK